MLKEFRDFAMKGNVVDLAIAVVLGAAFTAIVNSIVKDLIMPPIGLLLGGVNFTDLFWVIQPGPAAPYATLEAAAADGAVTINYGLFLAAVINFIVIALVLFFIVRGINRMQKKQEAAPAAPTTKECPYCFTSIAIQATRCPNCTSQL